MLGIPPPGAGTIQVFIEKYVNWVRNVPSDFESRIPYAQCG